MMSMHLIFHQFLQKLGFLIITVKAEKSKLYRSSYHFFLIFIRKTKVFAEVFPKCFRSLIEIIGDILDLSSVRFIRTQYKMLRLS
jgi:hypothetical protein